VPKHSKHYGKLSGHGNVTFMSRGRIRVPVVEDDDLRVALRWNVYPKFIADGDQIVSKTYMTRVEGENTRLRHYLARLHRKTLCGVA